ncbi:hypothetical protein PENTCL1PPCAC_23505, partial [Pristionchus entomophagus]
LLWMVGQDKAKTASTIEVGPTQEMNTSKDQTGALYENMTIPDRARQDDPPPETGTPVDPSKEADPSKATPTASTPEPPQNLVIDLAPGGIPEKDAGVEARGEFSNNIQYLLACIGYAVGLGNIWRFPSVAYQNGGGAFLVPYIMVSLFFGLPTLYIECALGQFTQFGPSKAFKFYMPISQGIGWAMSLISLSIALYYNVIVAWSMVYLYYTVTNLGAITSCDNYWNTKNCSDAVMCKGKTINELETRYFNGSCHPVSGEYNFSSVLNDVYRSDRTDHFVSAPDEFFTYYITEKQLNFGYHGYNWKIAGLLTFCWLLTALGLWKGVKWLGRISMVTATVPYLIILILLGRGVTLPGAYLGIQEYLTRPDFSRVFCLDNKCINAWKAALTQICFSLSVGQGGMLAMSSYNKRSHKCFKDAVLVMFADCLMSIIGGVAVFSVLGFMADSSGKAVKDVVPSPLSLAFVAYPEAISQMPAPIVWSLLFFFMIFMLGISTMFGLLEGFITCLCDSSAFFRAHHALTVVGTCFISAVLGLVFFCSSNGFHFFNIFNEYIGSFSLAVVIVFEIIVVVFVYGPRYFLRDMEAQFGRPSSFFGRVFGSQGMLIKFLMCITAPVFALGVLVITMYDLIKNFGVMDKIGLEKFDYPPWALAFGLLLAAVPLSAIPIFAIINCVSSYRSGKGLGSVFRVTDDHPALRYKLEDPPSFLRFWLTPLTDPVDATQTITATTRAEPRKGTDRLENVRNEGTTSRVSTSKSEERD